MGIKLKKNKGLIYWDKAKKIIPGGNGLLSKRPERYAPDIWPTYFNKCYGVEVFDLEGKKYIDMAQMGLGTSILGYANQELNQAVSSSILNGVNCTLNCKEELDLAEKLIELNPNYESVKFARSGGEAMAIAIRIARAYSKKTKIAFSGYHGWHDWYLATNLKNKKNLNEHLLPGLKTEGVPDMLKNTIFPFSFNDSESFLNLIKKEKDIGIVCVEGARFNLPKKEFLNTIMDIAKKKNLIIISDEITSGWRLTDGGIYKINNFKPDIVVYGKAMGGGFAISAIVGKKEIMASAQESFVSSTMWTERVGFVAALKTIEILTRDKSWEHLNDIGSYIGEGWLKIKNKLNLKMTINDFKPLISFNLGYGEFNDKILTLFSQEMLKKGYLTTKSVYVSTAHTQEIVDEYLVHASNTFEFISDCIKNKNIDKKLISRPRSDSFARTT